MFYLIIIITFYSSRQKQMGCTVPNNRENVENALCIRLFQTKFKRIAPEYGSRRSQFEKAEVSELGGNKRKNQQRRCNSLSTLPEWSSTRSQSDFKKVHENQVNIWQQNSYIIKKCEQSEYYKGCNSKKNAAPPCKSKITKQNNNYLVPRKIDQYQMEKPLSTVVQQSMQYIESYYKSRIRTKPNSENPNNFQLKPSFIRRQSSTDAYYRMYETHRVAKRQSFGLS